MQLVAEPSVFARTIIVTNADHRFAMQDQLAALKIGAEVVPEPIRCGSAPAVAVAAEPALAVVGVFAADHVVKTSPSCANSPSTSSNAQNPTSPSEENENAPDGPTPSPDPSSGQGGSPAGESPDAIDRCAAIPAGISIGRGRRRAGPCGSTQRRSLSPRFEHHAVRNPKDSSFYRR